MLAGHAETADVLLASRLLRPQANAPPDRFSSVWVAVGRRDVRMIRLLFDRAAAGSALTTLQFGGAASALFPVSPDFGPPNPVRPPLELPCLGFVSTSAPPQVPTQL